MESDLTDKVGQLEQTTNHLFKIVFERLDALEDVEFPKYEHPVDRLRIGLKSKGDK